MGREQIGVTFKGQEKEIIKKMAEELGLPLAQVVREFAMEGIDARIERLKRRKEYLEESSKED